MNWTEADWSSQETRDQYFKDHPENFADRENQAFPIKDAEDVTHAAQRHGSGTASAPAVKSNIISIAKRLDLASSLPAEWQEDLYTDQDASGGGLPDPYGSDKGQGVYGTVDDGDDDDDENDGKVRNNP